MAWHGASARLFWCSILASGSASAQVPATVPTGSKVVGTAPASPPPSSPSSPVPNTVESARKGVVLLERQGKPVALGVVLEGDGRILTALSPLANGNFLSIRYADGYRAPVRLAHSDRGWDLALLLPQPQAPAMLRKSGVRAARAASFVGLQTFTVNTANEVTIAPVELKLASSLLGGDGKSLTSAYELRTRPGLVGAPIVNASGEVVALVARACPAGAGAGCAPAPYAAPVSALKSFLQGIPVEATWLGVQAAVHDGGPVRGVRIVSITSGSPAALAGLRSGTNAAQADLIVAVDGSPVSSPAELNEAIRSRAADAVELLLFGLGRYRHVTLKPAPEPRAAPSPASKPEKAAPSNPYR